ncbi:MAG TPA: Ig-like domain-containing protein [Thermoanaerobaculia bacterium]|nr:Ig-like domain-containing protein [Thermoanaerobaculia bacterium]
MSRKSAVRQLLALILAELVFWQPSVFFQQPLFGVAQAAPRAVAAASFAAAPAEESSAPDAPEPQSAEAFTPIASGAGLAVSVAFADSASSSTNFPTPWQGAPNVLYLGGGSPVNAGAIRIDNTSGAAVPVERVSVDLQRDNAKFELWTNFVIPARGSAILTQTAPGNFDTSAYPIVACGESVPAGDPRVPKISITIGGVTESFTDTAHVLDTGGFDSSCRGNESLQWRAIGTRGPDFASGALSLTPANVSGAGGSSITLTAKLKDTNGTPLANVVTDFAVTSGPNAGQTGQGITDSLGNARFTYLGSAQGADVVHASIANASGATLVSNDATVAWTTASCGPDVPLPPSGQASLLYIGATRVQYSDAIELAALLTDDTGAPVAGRTLTFTFGTSTLSAVTDATGVARMATIANVAPSEVVIAVDYAGGSDIPALHVTQTVTVDREDVLLEYTGRTLLGTAVPQTVSARLRDPDSLAPLADKSVTFTVGSVTATAVTDAAGNAVTTIVLGADQVSGPGSLTVAFAGDPFYEPAFRTAAVTIYLSTSFVVWGGNDAKLKLGDRVNFWGAQWESQVLQGDYPANASFKGFADPIEQIHVCQPNATSKTLTPTCWISKGGQSWPPPVSVPNFIEVIISTVIERGGNDIYGNIAAAAVVKVEPGYGPVPGKPGFGTIVAVIEDSGVFPAPAAITATQTQPATLLPSEQFTIATTITNASNATAATSVVLRETLDGLSPDTITRNVGMIAPAASQSITFDATTPSISIRGAGETAAEYLRRLSSLNGRVYTSAGQVTFTDANAQLYLPVSVASRSVLTIPVLTLALTGPAVVSPGAPAPYRVTITNIGSAVADASVDLKLPDGTTRTFRVDELVPGSSFAQIETFTPEALAPKGANETTEEYLARIQGADGQLLTTKASVTWRDAHGNAYGDVGQQIFTSRIRVPVLTFTTEAPATLLPTQIATLRMHVRNNGGCTATLSNLSVVNPDGSTTPAPQFVLAAGESTTIETTWRVPEVPKRDEDGETDAQYLARLEAVDDSNLDFGITLDWSDPSGALYGPISGSTQAREIISIVPVTLTAPATAVAGTSITYTIGASNLGSATAPQIDLTITLPDGTMQKPAVPSLVPGATFETTLSYAIPSTQAAGLIDGDAFVMWTDSAGNAYGPFEASASTEVMNPTRFNSLVLSPATAGPNVKGITQTMTATLTGEANVPLSGEAVQFTVSGANNLTGSATTNAEGIATFTYTGANAGTDSVQATAGTAVSNTATVNWIAPVQSISTSPMFARFFFTNGSGTFNTPAGTTPAFIQAFPTINFNPPSGTVPGNTSGVGVTTRPFTNVTTDLNGNFTGTIIAQGNGLRAGEGTLFDFQAVFTGSFTVASAGQMAISFYSDDGFIFGVGGGATRVSGPMLNVPAGNVTPFEQLPVMGAYNAPTAPVANTVVVSFPAAGTYPYEVDYSECCAGQLALTVAAGNVSNRGLPPTGSLKLAPTNLTAKPTGETQTLTVDAFDASGLPVANANLSLVVNGPNAREIPGVTDGNGRATFSYSASRAGTDTAQAIGRVAGLGTFSNVVNVPWSVGAPTGEQDPDFPPGPGNIGAVVTQGWLGAPLIGSTLTTRTNVTVSGVSLVSGRLDLWPSDNPNEVVVLNANVTGSGTVGAIDPTTLANGEYYLRLTGTLSNGTQQTSLIVFNVTGDNKPGRVTKFVTDLRLPMAGMPVTISRRYDSLERGKIGDFGYGWSLVTSVRLEVNKQNDVTFTLNGRRQTFKFTPQSYPFPFPFFLQPKWTAQPGSYGTLTAESCGLLILSQGQFTCFLDTVGGGFHPTSYTYTDPYGRQYVMDPDGTLKLVKDLNGNTLTFTRDGIISSATGVTVPFVRDTTGRITRILDPAGHVYDYRYDGAGDLIEVQLPEITNPVQYEYASGHFLTKEIDPRGGSTSATYYPDGRVKSETDRMNNTVQFAYNTTANTTTYTYADGGVVVRTNNAFGKPVSIKDQLNRTTSFTYDANGNMLTRTDPLGKIWTFTYDANGNLTSAKDPNGNISKKNWDSRGRLLTVTDALNQVKSFNYDNSGNVTALSDSIGQIIGATYDAKGNQTSMTLPSGQTAQFGYDSYGNITSLTDHSGFASALEFDAMGQLVAMRDSRHGEMRLGFDAFGNQTLRRDPSGNTLQYTYDRNGNRITETDPNGNPFTHEYDANDRKTRTTFPDGTHVDLTYDFAGRLLTRTDEDGNVEKYAWDKAGQLTSVTGAFGTTSAVTTTFQYDPAGRLNSVTDARNNTTVLTYDDAGRVKTMRDPAGRSVTFAYDANNQVTAVTRADGVKHETRYDPRGRPTTIINPDGTTSRNVFDGLRLSSIIREDGRTTSYTYDNHGEIASVTDPAGQVTRYFRDAVGNVTGVRDANGHDTTYEYDITDRLVKKIQPDGSYEQYTYDPAGHLTAVRLTDGNTNQYVWDGRDRLTRIEYFNGTTTSFTYTPSGRRDTATAPNGVTRYEYDALDRLVKITQPTGVIVSYGYDAADNITSITTPRGITRYTYDALDRVKTMTDPSGGVTTYTYDLGGRLTQRLLPNGVITDYTYDSLDRLQSVAHHLGAAASFESFVYTLSPDGQRLSVQEVGGTRTSWTYDDAYRLIRETVANASGTTISELAYAYDQAGNRTSMTANGVTTLYQYNQLDQLTAAGSAQYTYDARGNLVKITDGSGTTTYTYDPANRLATATMPDGRVANFSYDADGRLTRERVGSATRNFAWNELSEYGDIVYESDGAGASLANYSYGAGELVQRLGTSSSYYVQDGLGSVIGLTNGAGAETDRYRYDAYGNLSQLTGTTTNPFGYRGQFGDDVTSLLYLRARWFAPGIGRFLTRDTADFRLDDPIDLNRYVYAGANPINLYDPTGYTAAAEYGLIARQSAENATIEGYIVGRRAETLLSCALVVLMASFVDGMLRGMIQSAVPNPLSGKKIWRGLPNVITIAFGWMVKAPVDVPGPDYMWSPATEAGRKVLLEKAAVFRAAPRELNWAMSGRYVNGLFALLGRFAEIVAGIDGVFLGNDQNLADKCSNHAERKIVRHASPPANALLSVGASRPVCNNCMPVLLDAVVKYGGCIGPIGTNNQCKP